MSPNGKRLVFASFNDTDVDTMHIPIYGESSDIDSQYPHLETIRYPKV